MEKFFDLPCIGDLFLEHVFYMLDDEPILFVCKDIENTKFLCSCCRLYLKWVVGQVVESELIDLIDDRMSIRAVFEECDTKFVVEWTEGKFEVTGDVHDSVLPQIGALLELDREKSGEYRKYLVQTQKQRQSIQVAAEHKNRILSEWAQHQVSIFKYSKQHQEIYANIQKDCDSFVPNTISNAISIQLVHHDANCWSNLAQYIQSISAMTESKGKKVLVVRRTTKTYTDINNQLSSEDKIQYFAS